MALSIALVRYVSNQYQSLFSLLIFLLHVILTTVWKQVSQIKNWSKRLINKFLHYEWLDNDLSVGLKYFDLFIEKQTFRHILT